MSKYNFILQLKEEEKELLETLKALQVLIKRYETEGVSVNEKPTVGDKISQTSVVVNDANDQDVNRSGFDFNSSIPKKLLYALGLLVKGTSREVGEKVFELDQSRTKKQWVDDARFYLSKYYNEKKLIVIKDGSGRRGYVYALPN